MTACGKIIPGTVAVMLPPMVAEQRRLERREGACARKQGMVQAVLTGRTRSVNPHKAAI